MNRRLAAPLVAAALLAGCSFAGPTLAPPTAPTTATTGAPTTGPATDSPTGSPTESPPPTAATPGPATEAPDAALQRYYSQRLAWRGCGGEFQCATLTVPVDYATPGGDTFALEVLRTRAAGGQRLGSLVVNPGGPGGSGVDYARAARAIVTAKVLAAYDVVGFDPRGVATSDPVRCLTGPQTDALLAADGAPTGPAGEAAAAAVSRSVGLGCQQRSPATFRHVDTVSAARDMDVLRAALGERRLTYLGKSYGTFLGLTYADLFPARVGRFVLDGVLPADLGLEEVALGQAKGFEDALRRFAADCAHQDFCPLPKTVDAAMAKMQAFFAGLEGTPLPAEPGRPLTQALGLNAVLSYLYAPPGDWESLRYGLADAFDGDGSTLLSMLDFRIQRNPDGSFVDNSTDALYAVTCLDRPMTGGVERTRELAAAWAKEAPTFGPSLAWGNLPCSGWPGGASGTPEVVRAEGAAPMLVVSTRHDPATPYEWGVRVAGQLASAALVTYEGDGHTAYMNGSACVDAAVDAYLLRGALPAEDPDCPKAY